ncbi:hypothetical protein [Rhizobium leguminosarum]|uniref:hypothetical protein n=1 Tax=Rhizobium leguminosarum TaxID=384 RepID=UPI003F976866
MVQFGGSLLWAFGATIAAWLVLRFGLEPIVIRKIRSNRSQHVAAQGASLAVCRTLQTLLVGVSIAFVVAVVGAFILSNYIEALGADANTGDATSYEKLVALRDMVEQVLQRVSAVSQGVWVVSLALLALIWLAVSYSGSRRRWAAALDARVDAMKAMADSLSPEEIDEVLGAGDGTAADRLASESGRIAMMNLDHISRARAKDVLAFGERGEHRASIDDLVKMRNAILADLEAGEVTPDDKKAAEESSSNLAKIIEDVEKEIVVTLWTLDGKGRNCALAEAEQYVETSPSETLQWKRDAFVALKVRTHEAQGALVRGREPELISEWVGAAITGAAAVGGVSRAGRAGGFVAIVAVVLGLIGVGAGVAGPSLVLRAEALEIDFAKARASLAVDKAMAANPLPPFVEPEELASDEVTTEYVRNSFRVTLSNNFRQTLGVNKAIDRASFEIGAVEARRKLLSSAVRNAAPGLEAGTITAREAFVATYSPSATTDAEAYVDEVIDRRIERLRKNESLWTKFRREAFTPVPPNHAAEALLRTILGDGAVPNQHAFRVATERSIGHFAAEASRLGSVTKATASTASVMEMPPSLMTARDQRLIGDFKRTAPQSIELAASALRSGDLDPGSLHRVAMNVAQAPDTIAPGMMRTASAYTEQFPVLAEGAGAIFDSFDTNGKPVRTATRAASARSFSKIRFSAKVGGVVIGREPDAGGDEIKVVDFEWRRAGQGRYVIKLRDAEGRSFDLGPFHPALIYGALAYAADGRVVTSTLPKPTNDNAEIDGRKINARRVLVHPALEDTSVACPAIQVDRFVDGFTYREQANVAVRQLQLARSAVDQYGDLLGIVGSIPRDLRLSKRAEFQTQIWDAVDIPQIQPQIGNYVKACGMGEACFPIEYYQKHGFDFGNSTEALQCLTGGGDCFEKFVSLTTDYSYFVDSGVREQSFKLDKDFHFLTGTGAVSGLWPLDFIVQVIPQRADGLDTVVAPDVEPWIFPTVADEIRKLVREGVQSDPSAMQVFNTMKDFVVLQRLFRLALAGSLGLEFPLDRLSDLQKETKPAMNVQRHERWNLNSSIKEILMEQAEALAQTLDQLKNDSAASGECRAAANDALADHQALPWPDSAGIWRKVGLAASACTGAYAGYSLNQKMKLLRELDLVDDAILYAEFSRNRPAFYCDPL